MHPSKPSDPWLEPPSLPADVRVGAQFCLTCAFSEACIAGGYDKPEQAELHCLVEHVGPYRAGEQTAGRR